MIIRVTHPDHEGKLAKLIVNEERRAVTVYVDGRDLLTAIYPQLLKLWDDGILDEMRALGFVVEVLNEKDAVNVRIAAFCKWYKHFKGVAYKASAKDIGMMKNIVVSEALLRFYMDDQNMPDNSTTWLFRGKQSIGNLVKYFNQVRASMVAPIASKHPNVWSREHLNKLDGPGISDYHRHLKSLGLVAKTARDGSVLDYIPQSDASTH
ncbi:MAG: hypothetical protein ABI432_08740 [Flavobacteriales bacterium]